MFVQPWRQVTSGQLYFYVRSVLRPDQALRAIPQVIKKLDPNLPVEQLKTLPQQVKDNLAASVPFPKRLGNPPEYANLALTMIENGYFNGEDVRLDGAIRMAPR